MLVGFTISLLGSSPVLSYNRMTSHQYALDYSEQDAFNTLVYRNYGGYGPGALDIGGDCANFVCQCLIAGGAKFRHCHNSLDNLEASGGSLPELETRTRTFFILNKDVKYSRTIIGADELPASLTNRRHGATKYWRSEYLANDSKAADLWGRVLQKGDVAFHAYKTQSGWWDSKHSIFISTVIIDSKELRVCTHGAHHRDEPITVLTGLDDWKTEKDGMVWIVHIPDSPCVVPEVTRVLAGTTDDDRHEICSYWKGKKIDDQGQQEYFPGRNLDLDVQITFDSLMMVDNPQSCSFKLRIDGIPEVPFQGLNGGGWENGWWRGQNDDGLNRYSERTWRGRIRASELSGGRWPSNRSVATVVIFAKGRDGSVTD